MTRMLNKAGRRQMLVPSRGRCPCDECAIDKTAGQQRAREQREWLAEWFEDET